MLRKLSVAILLFTLAEIAVAQVVVSGKCPDAKVMNEFDLEAYTGIWYEYAKFRNFFELNQKCAYAKYTDLGDNTVGVVNSAFDITTNWPAKIEGYAKVLGPARLAVVFFNRNEENPRENYTVLGTDYKTYALVFSCSELSKLFNLQFLWILTRDRIPSAETIATVKELMAQNGISETYLEYTQQEGCPAPEKYN